MESFITKLKFYLGLKCVMKLDDEGWVITQLRGGLRVCKDRCDNYWWCTCWDDYCIFPTKESAIKAMNTKRFNFDN